MAFQDELQYLQPAPMHLVPMDLNFPSDIIMTSFACQNYEHAGWNVAMNQNHPEFTDEDSITASDSPRSKSGFKDEKRRLNNRVSQRAYRDRKTKHVTDLEDHVREIERRAKQLQNENRKFVRELCEIRVNNKDLRTACDGDTGHPERSSFRKGQSLAATKSPTPPSHRKTATTNSSRSESESARTEETNSSDESLSDTWDELRSTYRNVDNNVLTEAMLETLIEVIDSGISLTAPPSQPVQSVVDRRKMKK